ncbi:MAG TPA: DPP IV N-terminal domain-containing protein [Thermoleophilaceae bacterium]|jgi:hypothetical protein
MAARRVRNAVWHLALTSLVSVAATTAWGSSAHAADQLVWEGWQTLEIGNENGTNRRALTSGCNGMGAVNPALSPDGQTVAYDGYLSGGICTVDVSGQSPRLIFVRAGARDPEFSADGTQLYFEATATVPGLDIYVASVTGSGVRLAVSWPGAQYQVAVHPNGTKLAFVSDKTPAGKALSSPHVYVTGDGGGGAVDIGIGYDPTFSPDGSKVAFTRGNNIYSAPSTGGKATQLTSGGLDDSPDWSPNGQIAFIRRTSSGPGWYNIWQMSSTGSGQTLIVDGSSRSVLAPSYRQPSTARGSDDRSAGALRPLLLFDSGERWRPININWFLGETHRICDSATCGIVSTPDDLRNWPNPGTRIDIEGDGGESNYASPAPECNVNGLQDCDTGSRSAIYYNISGLSSRGYRYFDYWFFYRYNDTPDLSFTDHEGDWESVSVAGSSTTANTFDFASFSGHGRWHSYLRDNLSCDDGPRGSCGTESAKTGRRVNVFVAAGSHANYAEPCGGPCTQTNNSIPEMNHNGAYFWGRSYDPPADTLFQFPAAAQEGTAWTAGPRNWTDWPGIWSGNGGVASPGNQGHFKTPWDNLCADGSDCPPETKTAVTAARARQKGLPNCASWFGPGVAAVSCDPVRLKRALDRRELGEAGSFRIARQGKRTSASAPGIAQALGAPLRAGATLSLTGTGGKNAQLLLRVRSGKSVFAATFASTGLSRSNPTARVKVVQPGVGPADGRPRVVLVRANGSIVKPLAVTRMRK